MLLIDLPFSGMEQRLEDELNNFSVKFPGILTASFCDNSSLLNFVESQYPDWKNKGKTTSVPIARVPKIFLHANQMPKDLQSHYQATIKGEEAEIKVYRHLLNLRHDQEGLLIFPNINGTEIFRKQSAELHVELDTVMIHPKKGIFIFNVKNAQGRHGFNENNIKSDLEKHTKFI